MIIIIIMLVMAFDDNGGDAGDDDGDDNGDDDDGDDGDHDDDDDDDDGDNRASANCQACFGSGEGWGSGSECFSAFEPLWNILNSTRMCLVPITPRKGVLHARYISIAASEDQSNREVEKR